MSTGELTVWLSLMLLGFAGSALYSGLETGVYSLNRVRLQVAAHQHRRGAASLRRLIDRPSLVLSTLLMGNNIANYLGSASLTIILTATQLSETQTIILNTLIVTPILFVFGETLPKDLFSAHADRLMYRLAPALVASRWLFTLTGLVPLVNLFSGGLVRLVGGSQGEEITHPRRQVTALMKEGVGHGVLSDEQSVISERVLSLTDRRVRQEMVPWDAVLTVRVDDGPQRLWELASKTPRSRFPVLDRSGKVVGVVNLLDALLLEKHACPPVRELMSPPATLPAGMPLREAMKTMQRERVELAVVMEGGERGRPVGVVTIKDLVEPITGEIEHW